MGRRGREREREGVREEIEGERERERERDRERETEKEKGGDRARERQQVGAWCTSRCIVYISPTQTEKGMTPRRNSKAFIFSVL